MKRKMLTRTLSIAVAIIMLLGFNTVALAKDTLDSLKPSQEINDLAIAVIPVENMGYDHIEEEDKIIMRQKEEKILNDLNIIR